MHIKTVATAGVAAAISNSDSFNQFVLDSIRRHFSSDWGEVSEDDTQANNAAPLYALSAYTAWDGRKIRIKQNCNVLTVLFPDEY